MCTMLPLQLVVIVFTLSFLDTHLAFGIVFWVTIQFTVLGEKQTKSCAKTDKYRVVFNLGNLINSTG